MWWWHLISEASLWMLLSLKADTFHCCGGPWPIEFNYPHSWRRKLALTHRAPLIDSYSRPRRFSGTLEHWEKGGDLTPLMRTGTYRQLLGGTRVKTSGFFGVDCGGNQKSWCGRGAEASGQASRKGTFTLCINITVTYTQQWSCNLRFERESLRRLAVTAVTAYSPALGLLECRVSSVSLHWGNNYTAGHCLPSAHYVPKMDKTVVNETLQMLL